MFILATLVPPATAPTTLGADSIATAFHRLMDDDASVREAARDELMSMRRSDLPRLRELARSSAPLTPDCAAALHEIVVHVFARGDSYEPDHDGTPMLGFLPQPVPLEGEGTPIATGVKSRTPGMVANQVLRDGDILLDILERSEELGEAEKARQARETEPRLGEMLPFVLVLRTMQAGEIAHLKLERAGRQMVVAIRLDPAPQGDDNERGKVLSERAARAEAFWKDSFAGLLKNDEQSSARGR